jgi:fibronectin type 3 domain-containing protein
MKTNRPSVWKMLGALLFSLSLFSAAAQTITVTSPNGGENWVPGSVHSVTWTISGNTANINYQLVALSTDGGVNYNNISGAQTPSARSFSWTIPAGTSSTQARIRVRALDVNTFILAQDASDSNFTISSGTVPASPTSLTAVGAASSIGLSWTDNANNEQGFYIERKIGAGGTFAYYAAVGANVTSYTDYSVSVGNTYYYRVYAYNAAGYSLYYSNEASAAPTGTVPASPTSLTAVGSASSIGLSWTDNANNEQGFYIERKIGAGGTFAYYAAVGANVTSYTDSSVSVGTTYYYQVYAYNAVGYSPYYSNVASATPTGSVPASPTSLTAVGSASSIGLSWTDNANNEQGFYIERKIGAGGTFAYYAAVGANVTSYIDSSVSAGTTYYYQVYAYNAAGYSPYYSNVASAALQGAASLSVSIPNGGENWTAGSTYNVAWTISGDTSQINYQLVAYSTDNFATYVNVSAALTPGTRSFSWTVPSGLNSSSVKVRVRALDVNTLVLAQDNSDSNFTVSPAVVVPTMTLSSPNAGATWQVGTSQTVGWSVSGDTSQISYFVVRLSLNNGSSYTDISANLSASTRSFNYTPNSGQVSSSAVIWVRAFNSGGTVLAAAISSGAFTISNPLGAPTVQTLAASSVGTSSARLNGTVNPNGLSTTYNFQYGTTASYGSTSSSGSFGAGITTVQSVNSTVSGLAPGTTYHYRLVASSSGGPANGSDLTFPTAVLNQPVLGVGNVSASQRSGTKIVDIWYDLTSPSGNPVNVSMSISINNGASFDLPASSFSGAIGAAVVAGNSRQIIWNAGADWNNQVSSQVKFRITANSSVSGDSPAIIVDTRDTARPVVQDVTSPYCGAARHAYFLNGVSLNQTFTVVPNWNTKTPSSIKFIGPWGTHTQTGTLTTRTYNVGTDFGAGNHLTVKLVASDGTESLPYQVNFDVISKPPGIPIGLLYAKPFGATLTYATPEYSFDVLDSSPEVVPRNIPVFGGEKIGFVPGVKASAEVTGDGSASAEITTAVGSELSMAGFDVDLHLTGKPEWTYSQGQNAWISSGYVGLKSSASISTPPAYVWATPPIYFRGDLDIETALSFGIDGWNALGDPILNGKWDFNAQFTGVVGCGASGFLAVEGYLGGGPVWTVQYPVLPALKQLGLELDGGVKIVLLFYTYDIGLLHYEWWAVGPSPAAMSTMQYAFTQQLNKPDSQQWKLMSRDYLSDSTPYSSFLVGKTIKPMFWGDPVISGIPLELQTNIWPYSEPALSVSGTNRLLLLVTDNPARTAENRTELIWSKWNGSTWVNPTSIWNDATADFAPMVKLFPDGSALAVWQNEKTVLTNGATLDTALAGLEIAAAKFNPTTGVWTPTNLTDNTYLDRTPQLAAGANGKALLAWISNPTNSALGATNALNTIQSRLWDSSAWQAVATISANGGMLLWSTVAFDGTNGVFLATIDPDDDQSTTGDQELWGATFNGTAWSTFSQITTNAVSDTKPQAVYDSTGKLLVAWHQGSNIVMRIGDLDLQHPAVVGAVGGTSSAKDFTLVTGPSGQISMVWEDLAANGGGPDPLLLNYDTTLGVWSQPLRLLNNTNQLERSFSAAYANNGSLLLAYNRVAVAVDTNNVPSFGQVDLMVLDYLVGNDLAVKSSDINLSTNNPAPGQSVNISAVVRNNGEFAATNVQTAFYDGDPSSGGSLIGSTQTVAGALLAGSNATVQVTWLVPQTTSNRTIYVVVDPALAQADRNRSDNTATKTVLAPDLQISDMTVLQSSATNRVINARCINRGTIPSGTAVEVSFHRGAANGPILTNVIISALATDGTYDASFEWNLSGLAFTTAVEVVYATIDEGNLVTEADKGNNTRSVSVMTSLDSDGDGLLDGEESSYGTNPQAADSDGDGLNDGVEVKVYHTNPLLTDTDGDGMSDNLEIMAGTDPNSATSVLKLTNVRQNGPGSFQFSLNGAVGSNYVIQVSTNLVNWSPFSTNVIPAGGFVIITDPNMATNPRRFYRIAPLPSVTVQPVSRTNVVSSSVMLNVTATGTLPLSFQWRKEGTNVSGATDRTYTIVGIQTNDGGDYSVVVSDVYGGAVASSVAVLTVRPLVPPTVLAGPVTNPGNGHMYYLLNQSTWVEAEAAAVALGGHLATIRSAAEQAWVHDSFNRWGGTERHLWIGLYDSDPLHNATTPETRKSEFVWASGEPVTYTLWADGEPNNWQELGEFWVHTFSPLAGSASGYWNDAWDTDFNTISPVNGVVEVIPRPQLIGMTLSNGVFRFVLNGPVGNTYVIQVSSNLVNWTSISTNTIPAGGLMSLITPGPANKPRQFYRAVPFAGTIAGPAAGTVVAWGTNDVGQINVPPDLTNVVAIAAGYKHNLALKVDGTVVGWGENELYQTNVPVGLSNVIAIAAGWGSSLALKRDGTLESWGWGSDTNGSWGITNTAHSLSNITAIATGWDCLIALKSDRTVVVWGKTLSGETNYPAGLTNVTAIAGGAKHVMALKGDGTVVAWGDNSTSQTNVPAGLNNVTAIAAGGYYSLARKTDGTVVGWGSGQANAPGGLANVIAISAGDSHSLALKNDRTVVAWGDNSSGQTNVPVNLSKVFAISAGGFHSLVITNR